MKLNQNSDEFQDCVEALSEKVASAVIETLKAYSIPQEYIDKVKGELSFNICCVIDGANELDVKNKVYAANMGFLEQDTETLHSSVHGTCTKDYVYDFTDD